MCLQYSRPTIYYLFPKVWKASYIIRESIFVDVPYWPSYSTDKLISYVSGPSQWFFHFGEEIVIAWTREKKRQHFVVQNPIILHDNARSHTAAAGCHGTLAPLAMGDSETSTVLTRYEWKFPDPVQASWYRYRHRHRFWHLSLMAQSVSHCFDCWFATHTDLVDPRNGNIITVHRSEESELLECDT